MQFVQFVPFRCFSQAERERQELERAREEQEAREAQEQADQLMRDRAEEGAATAPRRVGCLAECEGLLPCSGVVVIISWGSVTLYNITLQVRVGAASSGNGGKTEIKEEEKEEEKEAQQEEEIEENVEIDPEPQVLTVSSA